MDLNSLWGASAPAETATARSKKPPTLPTTLKVLKPLLEAEGLYTRDTLTLSTGTRRHDGHGSQRKVFSAAMTTCTYSALEIPSRNLRILSVSHAPEIIFVTNAPLSDEQWQAMQRKIVAGTFHFGQMPAAIRPHPSTFQQLTSTGAIMLLPYSDQDWRDQLLPLLKPAEGTAAPAPAETRAPR